MYSVLILACLSVTWAYNVPHHIHHHPSFDSRVPPSAWNPPNKNKGCELDAEPPEPESQCCGVDSSSSDYIIGGNVTTPDQYPWTVLIEYYDKKNNLNKTSCSGFLVSGRYVISAAHCFVGREVERVGQPVNIILGEYNRTNEGRDCMTVAEGEEDICNDGAVKVGIEKILVHPKHKHNEVLNVFDIAVIRMKTLVPYTNFIRPICLPTSDITVNSPKDMSLFAAGWGAIKQENVMERGKWILKTTYADVKHHVEVLYKDTEVCRAAWGPFISNQTICAGGDGKDSCRGDSGSPLMFERNGVFEAVGIVSFGAKKCGLETRPSVYTNVYGYLDWLHDNMFKMEAEAYYNRD